MLDSRRSLESGLIFPGQQLAIKAIGSNDVFSVNCTRLELLFPLSKHDFSVNLCFHSANQLTWPQAMLNFLRRLLPSTSKDFPKDF